MKTLNNIKISRLFPAFAFAAGLCGLVPAMFADTGTNLVWVGDGNANSWDNNPGNLVWFNSASNESDFFSAGDNVLFDDTSANPSVSISDSVLPASVTVNAAADYTFVDNGGSIGGATGLTKTNSGTLYIENTNTFTGLMDFDGGVVSVSTIEPNGVASPIGEGPLNFNGGTFQYTGSASIPVGGFGPSSITLSTNGGSIDLSGYGYLFITNQISGSGSLTKLGGGQLILGDEETGTGSNDYDGITYITNGNLQIRNAWALGTTNGKTVITDAGGLSIGATVGGAPFVGPIFENFDLSGRNSGSGVFDLSYPGGVEFAGNISLVANASIAVFGVTDIISGPISGPGQLEKLGSGTLALVNSTNTYSGGTLITSGTLQLGTNGVTGWLAPQPAGVALIDNGTLSFSRADTNSYNGSITGSGGLSENGSGTTVLGGTNSFTGKVSISFGFLLVTNSYALGSDPAAGSIDVGLTGGNNNPYGLELAGNVNITNSIDMRMRNLVNSGMGPQPPNLLNASDTNTISSLLQTYNGAQYWGVSCDSGLLTVAGFNNGGGTTPRLLYLEGAGNGVVTTTIADAGTALQLVKYGTGTWTDYGTATLPWGVWVYQGQLVINSTVSAGGNTAGISSLVGGGELIINGLLPGPIIVTNGILGGTGTLSGPVGIQSPGTLAPGTSSIGTLTINNNLTNSGNMFVKLNKSLAQSNDFVSVSGILANTGSGTVIVTNLGPTLAAGDRFVLFNQPFANGNLLAISGSGNVTWTNNLALDGSISVVSVTAPVNTNTFAASYSVSGGSLHLSWPSDRLGWRLQVQTNSLNVGLDSNWSDWPGSTTVTNATIPINPANPAVFFRLVYP